MSKSHAWYGWLGSVHRGWRWAGVILAVVAAIAPRVSAESVDAGKLSWAPPELEAPATIEATSTRNRLKLDEGQDYVIKITQKISASGGLVIDARGARHIVIIGGEIEIPHQGEYIDNGKNLGSKRRALYIKDWSGTLHIEGLWVHGEDVAEGINLMTKYDGAAAQLQNIRVDGVKARPEEFAANFKGVHHPDILQSWAGPMHFRVDKLTGSSDYQGIFMGPLDHGKPIELAELRRINLKGIGPEGGRYLLWRKGGPEAVRQIVYEDVWVQPGPERIARKMPAVWPQLDKDPLWKDVKIGTPEAGDFVPEGVAGIGYQSPGYAAGEAQATAE